MLFNKGSVCYINDEVRDIDSRREHATYHGSVFGHRTKS